MWSLRHRVLLPQPTRTSLPTLSAGSGHDIACTIVREPDEVGVERSYGRIRCGLCRRTREFALPQGESLYGHLTLFQVYAQNLHVCLCGGVHFTDEE
jgi:hypothetical protein